MMPEKSTLEWFGATTFRLKTNGLTIFLDTWLERPSNIKSYLAIDDVTECDYIFISHAHFDHLPGADRIAIKTGAKIIANGEAINVMREAGVPEDQLLPVAGGERIPLFTKAVRDEFASRPVPPRKPGPPGPPMATGPDPSKAAVSVHPWPSLHCLMPGPPGSHPDVIDTATEYVGGAGPYACTIDITMGMKNGLIAAAKAPPAMTANAPPDMKAFFDYMRDTDKHKYSHFDGGQMMFNFLLEDCTLLWMSHLGGFDGVLENLQPRPDMVIMGIAGRGNINGRPFDGSAAQCATNILKWIGEPARVVWCLHDDAPIKPYRIETTGAKDMVEQETRSRVWTLEHAKLYHL